MMGCKRIIIGICFIFTCCVSNNAIANAFPALQQLVNRRLPSIASKIVFTKSGSKVETAAYYTRSGKLFIEASTINAASVALHQYLKKYCGSSFSETGDNINIPASLPAVIKKENIEAFFPIRYSLNYCTYNYTMSFWKWEDWEKELDRMSLNGVNLMLAPIGTEEVWQRTLKEFNFSDEEIKQFIPGPAFNAWWLMGNLEGWGGPVSNEMIKHWTSLQQKILPRMKELGITPVVQSFWGMVPVQLKKKYPNAAIVEQGKWLGMYQRPALLMPHDTLFIEMAAVYYKHFKQLYGTDFTHLGGDLFHEGGRAEGIQLDELGKRIQQNMQLHFPNATWVLQGWQDNPKAKMLKGLDKSKTLILDLLGDRGENWEKRNGYEQFPWVWCTITNFGGKQFMEGKLLRVLTEPRRATNNKNGKTLQGIGIIPEGIENNNIVYQWLLESAWYKEIPSTSNLIKDYVIARYGSNDAQLIKAWEYLLQSVYVSHNIVQAGGYESIFCARPDTNVIGTISCCGPKKKIYDNELLMQAGNLFASVANKYKNNDAFNFDLVDIWRQLLNLKGRDVYENFMVAYQKKDTAGFTKNKNIFLTLLKLQDRWTGSHTQFLTGSWIEQAKQMLPNEQDKNLAEQNARMQITFWGNDNAKTILHEYAAKEWNGILKDLYLERWDLFFNWADKKIRNQTETYPAFFETEKNWAKATNSYTDKPINNAITLLPKIKEAVLLDLNTADWKMIDFYKN